MNINYETTAVLLIVGLAAFFTLRGVILGNKKKCCGEKCQVVPTKP